MDEIDNIRSSEADDSDGGGAAKAIRGREGDGQLSVKEATDTSIEHIYTCPL